MVKVVTMGGGRSTQRQMSYERQASAASLPPASEEDPLTLPMDIVLRIFEHVPPREVVRVCTLVCSSWRAFFKDVTFWKAKMAAAGNYDGRLERLAHVNWPKLCVHTVYEPNLCRSFVGGSLSLEPWSVSYEEWSWFSGKYERRADRDRDQRRDWHQGGGNGWTLQEEGISFEALQDNCGSLKNYATSYEWCCREQVVDLRRSGFTGEVMDSLQPAIEVWEWFAARWDCGSVFNLRVDLLTEKRKVLKTYECSRETEQWQGGELGWRKEGHTFTDYGPGVRFIRFADAGKDTKYWAGHYGSKMAGAWVRVCFQPPRLAEQATAGAQA